MNMHNWHAMPFFTKPAKPGLGKAAPKNHFSRILPYAAGLALGVSLLAGRSFAQANGSAERKLLLPTSPISAARRPPFESNQPPIWASFSRNHDGDYTVQSGSSADSRSKETAISQSFVIGLDDGFSLGVRGGASFDNPPVITRPKSTFSGAVAQYFSRGASGGYAVAAELAASVENSVQRLLAWGAGSVFAPPLNLTVAVANTESYAALSLGAENWVSTLAYSADMRDGSKRIGAGQEVMLYSGPTLSQSIFAGFESSATAKGANFFVGSTLSVYQLTIGVAVGREMLSIRFGSVTFF